MRKDLDGVPAHGIGMNSSVLKTALRALHRDKAYALLNIVGLSVAIACCLILGAYLWNELTYDRYHVAHERIYRLVNEYAIDGRRNSFAIVSPNLGPMLAEDNADIQAVVRFRRNGQEQLIRYGEDVYSWSDVYTADPAVFEVFTHEALHGDPTTALDDPSSVAVSRRFAEQYFGDANPVGELITLENAGERRITVVFDDLPPNTHFKYDVLLSGVETFVPPEDITERRRQLYGINVYTYLLMPENYDIGRFDTVSDAFFDRHMAERGAELNATWRGWLQPLADIHLSSGLQYDQPTGSLYYLYGFIAVAVFTLVVACINYVNLATARAARRAREIGIRKVHGASRSALVVQFLAESMLLAAIATAVGVILAEIIVAVTPISTLIGAPIDLSLASSPVLLYGTIGLWLLVGIGAGLYPAFFLAASAPAAALLGGAPTRSYRLRECLVLTQFTISIAVVACTLLMFSQMRYIASLSLGFERENRLTVTLHGADTIEQVEALRTELLRIPSVLGVSWSTSIMGAEFPTNVLALESEDGPLEQVAVNHMAVGPGLLGVLGLTLIDGRDLVHDNAADNMTMIVNETLARQMGWESALGKQFDWGQRSGTVIGVVADFNFRSVHSEVEPFVLYPFVVDFSETPPRMRAAQQLLLVLNVSGADVATTIARIGDVVHEFDPAHAFQWDFLDDRLSRLYRSERSLMTLIAAFSLLCILIACLGLFGLAAFTTTQRTREIGIRKVLGARPLQIVGLLAKRTLVLVLVGAVLASAGTYVAMSRWLDGFAFHTSISPLAFVIAGAGCLAIAYATVALQSLKAARMPPVHTLRYE